MSDEETELTEEEATGPISWMAQNQVAANLLMVIVLVLGAIGLFRSKQEVFPDFTLDVITVAVPYPGASPAEAEQGIVLAVEERVRAVDGVKRITSIATEGAGTVSAELLLGADPDRVLADIKTEVDRIQTFPEEAEEPNVALLSRRQSVITLVISGDASRSTLMALAEQARSGILANEAVTQVEVEGLPDLEVAIEIDQEALQAYGMSLIEVSRQVRSLALELPGGGLKTDGGELLVRVSDRALTAEDFAGLEIRGTASGAVVLLGDIATISDGFEDNDQYSAFEGKPAVRLVAYRVGKETPKQVASAVREFAYEFMSELPDNVEISIWDDDSVILQERIQLLLKNGYLGLILVFGVLALFLDLRLAFWVGLGIPISFMGALGLMPLAGLSINMVTLFAFIVTLGLVVDDAIVVGENIFEKTELGMSPMKAAVQGTREMVVPVTFAILTTIAAFAPMLFMPGVMGKIFRLMPAVVILVLLFSLVESFFILPAHLGHGSSDVTRRMPWLVRLLWPAETLRLAVGGGLRSFIDKVYEPLLRRAVRLRYVTLATGVMVLLVAMGMVISGIVPRQFFPKLEGDVVTASARLPYGAPVDDSIRVRKQLESSVRRAIIRTNESGSVKGMLSRVGELPPAGGPGMNRAEIGSHLVSVQVQLVPTSQRSYSAEEFAGLWQEETPQLVGLESLSFISSVGPGAGAAVDAQLSHPDTAVLAAASENLAETLRTYKNLANIENGYAAGKPQLDFELLPQASTLGLTTNEIASQVRAAFYGAEALREQRGRHELKVMVRLPKEQRSSEFDLESLLIRTPQGGFVPLYEVASLKRGRAATSIDREAGQRVVNVSAERAPGVSSSSDVIDSLKEDAFPALLEKYPGLEVALVGEQREQNEAFGSLGWNYLVALFAIYALLAVPLKSYFQPAIIMSAIPFGLVGAIFGHYVSGYELSFVSAMGIVALSGVVINDALVLMDATNRKRREGASAVEAIVHGGTRRFRPILLTSLTTFFGLAPMILETSIQARFLIPMAISLGFGVLFATGIILLIVPALYMILEDVYWAWSLDPLPTQSPVSATETASPS